MELFEEKIDIDRESKLLPNAPLAARMRPETLEQIAGQEHILGEGKLLNRAIRADKISSLILYGPPGTGKTTIARVIANTTGSRFIRLNATEGGKNDVRKAAEEARDHRRKTSEGTILFIDEIHRFNKTQQDALLPHVEEGLLTLIGATTENPYYEVNSALVSRSRVFRLNPLSPEDIGKLLWRAVREDRDLRDRRITLDNEAVDFWAEMSDGDARSALNALELAALTTEPADGRIRVTLEVAEECLRQRALTYDKDGDGHYDTISAYILSVRGSDPDAALFYLMRMLAAGEDPKFIARRLIVCASEEVGNADPRALSLAVSAAEAVNFLGMPECRYPLAQATVYVACAPKSDAVFRAARRAEADVEQTTIAGIPLHIRDFLNSHTKQTGNGRGYKNSHDYDNHYVAQQYLPDELIDRVYYEPGDLGYEKNVKEWITYMKGKSERNI